MTYLILWGTRTQQRFLGSPHLVPQICGVRVVMPALKIIFDTTLRDGTQGVGISFSLEDKLRIITRINTDLGIPFIEAGWPGSNPKDREIFAKARELNLGDTQIVAFGSTRHKGVKADQDQNLKALASAGTEIVSLVGKSWNLHVTEALNATLEENLDMIRDSVQFLKDQGKRVFFDAEHFFDGYYTNREYAMQVLNTAARAGAELLVLCDTNGGYLPLQVQEAVKAVVSQAKIPIGIHCHNDAGFANSNALLAFQAGAKQIQGTFNGFGERCGNSDLVTLIPTLKFKLGVNCIDDEKIRNLTAVAHFIYELANLPPREEQPYVGRNAFSHKGGIHISAVLKDNRTYEHLDPLLVGNDRNIKVSELAGKSSIIYKAKQFGIPLAEGNPKVEQILRIIKEKERQGYSYEGADGSLELIMRSLDFNIEDPQFFRKKYFGIEGFRVISEHLKGLTSTEATIKVRVREKEFHTAAEGNGPVNAIDEALRKALVFFYPSLKNITLYDFKVRIIVQSGTASVVRVLVETKDLKTNATWSTIGAHENIIVASWEALLDSYVYKLLKDNIDWADKTGS